MTEDTILLEKSSGVARITLNRPALRNAFAPWFSPAMARFSARARTWGG
jgi:1,4-dihydroxy-2-naphthoyl-CoA synthase